MRSRELSTPTKYPIVVENLQAVVGKEWVSTRGVDRIAYSYDVWPVITNQVHRGDVPYWPEIIVWPKTPDDVQAVLQIASEHQLPIVPYAGGSGCVGGIVPLHSGITLDVKRMDQVLEIDPISRKVTVEAGIHLQELEDRLNLQGFTLGHFPQSMRSAAVGGTVAHNGIGTFSTRYGKFDDMILGMQVVLPSGEILKTTPVPKRSTGPNLNELFLGSEGTLGVVTQVTLKIHEIPEIRVFQSYAVSDMRTGLDIIRRIMQHDIKPAVVRLYDEIEGKGLLFESLNIKNDQCLLVLIYEGYRQIVELESQIGSELCVNHEAIDLGPEPSQYWYENKRYDVRHYLSATEKPSRIADTLEVAATWDRLANLYYEIRNAMERYPCRSMGHTSHVYPQGANLYMIFFAEAPTDNPKDVEKLYFNILQATFETCARLGATISHHHGIGMAKKEWMILDHGEAGMGVLQAIKGALDPMGIMNPGKLGLEDQS